MRGAGTKRKLGLKGLENRDSDKARLRELGLNQWDRDGSQRKVGIKPKGLRPLQKN